MGTRKEKRAFEALSMEIAEDPKRMRRIAAKLLTKAEGGDMAAIKEVFDRLDGKPAQTVDMNVDDKRTASDWTRDELVTFLANAANSSGGTPAEDGRDRAADTVH
ncbi:MAG: hypothetical protein GY952_06725 [Rhodobacteraceae bacterium]|nr:hypothetical protein [Paracoccaceae bacterium]